VPVTATNRIEKPPDCQNANEFGQMRTRLVERTLTARASMRYFSNT
jgi:hypothetical protein